MAVCVYCHKAKGKRSCPALGGLICSRCCGEHRLVRIACPADCIYLTTHEGYQRERTAQAFAVERTRILQGLSDQKAARLLTLIEAAIYRHLGQKVTSTDGEVMTGMEEVRRRLSPLAFPESTRSPFGEALWKDMEPFVKEVNRLSVTEAMDRYIEFAKSFSGTGLQSHQFLRGLSGFLEQYQPDMVKQIKKLSAPGRIIQV